MGGGHEKDWNDAHRAGHSAREHADAAWTQKQKQDEVEADAVGLDHAAVNAQAGVDEA